jgi:hypothetical protein
LKIPPPLASASASASPFTVVVFVFVVIVKIDGESPPIAPRYKFIPTDDALAALIPAYPHAPSEILRDAPVPPGLAYRAVYRVDVLPALIWCDLWEIRRR